MEAALSARLSHRDGEADRGRQAGEYTNAKVELSLFDLENDIGETKNVADKHPDVVER